MKVRFIAGGLAAVTAVTAAADTLTVSDCVNLFYNLLNTNTKENENKTKSSNTIYGAALGYDVSDDGEPFCSSLSLRRR